jgi:hypothetical protein
MTVGAAYDALVYLCGNPFPRPGTEDHDAYFPALGARVYVVKVETPEIRLTAIDARVRQQVNRDSLAELVDELTLASPSVCDVLDAVCDVPIAATVATPWLQTIGAEFAPVVRRNGLDHLARTAELEWFRRHDDLLRTKGK